MHIIIHSIGSHIEFCTTFSVSQCYRGQARHQIIVRYLFVVIQFLWNFSKRYLNITLENKIWKFKCFSQKWNDKEKTWRSSCIPPSDKDKVHIYSTFDIIDNCEYSLTTRRMIFGIWSIKIWLKICPEIIVQFWNNCNIYFKRIFPLSFWTFFYQIFIFHYDMKLTRQIVGNISIHQEDILLVL